MINKKAGGNCRKMNKKSAKDNNNNKTINEIKKRFIKTEGK